MRKSRPKRASAKRFVVYCEGETELNYVNGLKAWLQTVDDSIHIRIDSVCVGGGGYKKMLEKLRTEPDSNCIARLVMLDYDRCLNDVAEREVFRKLIQLSKSTADRGRRVPIILVVSNKDFEYALCCHDPKYSDGKTDTFLCAEWGYKDVSKCKADKKVWDKAHTAARSHEVAIEHLRYRPKLVENLIKTDKKALKVVLKEVDLRVENELAPTSNLKDLFTVLLMKGMGASGK